MTEEELNDLIDRYVKGECTPDEMHVVNSYFNQVAESAPITPIRQDLEMLQQRVWAKLGVKHKTASYGPFVRYAAALAVVFGLSIGYYHYINNANHSTNTETVNDIPPGGNKAILTLVNGQNISLSSTQSGIIIVKDSIKYNDGSSIDSIRPSAIKEPDGRADTTTRMLTVATPRGGQYQLVLADSTHVYLNAASTITFPSRFAGQTRAVSITGEVYFEVAKNKNQPFLVTTKGQQLKVLGTHFNVSAYPSETVKTTLAEGSVELTSSSLQKQLLKPDEQALLLSAGGFQVSKVRASDATAWRRGYFRFMETPANDAIRQVCRWYNVEADYDHLPSVPVTALLSKNLSLLECIRAIEFSNGISITLTNERKLKISKK
ncbi:FecR family protein [Chitinophaga sp. CF418]|uniref:FecR family protein n=1 Tax=Chitinophaga sp. CF418 TaxID=1855287 RepID=UPI0009102AE0|nr:FecR family protein [Chitinophaga sp. CF418]SHM83877.1 FecR family protein [Chitinophaga sp. CF418]